MCGICGIVIPPGVHRDGAREAVVRMRESLHHRGPDDAGLFASESAVLGFRRLSIVDLARGRQPMASDDGHLQLVFNGEIYNHADLRQTLVARGVTYHTNSDTESILRSFEAFGAETPSRLRGMFAFAIWDGCRRELFLARDRFGIKPLYYVQLTDGTLLFGSEIKALFASGWVRPEFDEAVLPDYLANHAPSGERTLFSGVRRLPPAHTLTWRDGAIHIQRYWDVEYPPTPSTASEAQLVSEYRERFLDAVRSHLMADVPLGVFLSGGIDSAAITAAMTLCTTERVRSFSVGFAEREANELHYARLVATRFGTDHHEIVITPQDFWTSLPRLIWHEDEPIAHPSSIPLHFVSRLAAEHVKVVLTGEGSDETLAGYNRYRVTVANLAMARAWNALPIGRMRDAVRAGINGLDPRSTVGRRLGRTFLARAGTIESLYLDAFAVFPRAQQQSLVAQGLWERIGHVDPYAAFHAAVADTSARDLLDRLLYADLRTYLHELLMKQDQMSMAASVESRVPFLDHPLVDFVATLPRRLKLSRWTTKYVLRAAMKNDLPPAILSRRKMGFPVPIGAWLRGPYRGLVDEFVLGDRAQGRQIFSRAAVAQMAAEHAAGRAAYGQQLWALITFEIWCRIFLDGEPVETIRVLPS